MSGNTNRDYDVIVVGGGPAGAATAAHLARVGRSVLLLDRAGFPRDKPCGEFYSPPVRGLLSELGVYEEVLAAGARRIDGATVRCASGRQFGGGFCASRSASKWAAEGGFSLERRVLDSLLWDNARRVGADTTSAVSVRGVLRDEANRICGVRTDQGMFTAPLIVGADGSNSLVAREMNVVRRLPHLQKIALVSHFSGVDSSGSKESDAAHVEMHLGNGGVVCGFGPGPDDTANVTLVVSRTEAAEIAGRGAAAYADALLSSVFPHLARRLAGARRTRIATCGTSGHVTQAPVADGALLVGDAAAFIDPFTGEGVYFALRGAQMAAEAIADALRRGDASARSLRPYACARRGEFAPKYMLCDLVQRVVHQRALIENVARRMGRRPHLAEQLLGITGDMVSPYRLLSPAYLLSLMTA